MLLSLIVWLSVTYLIVSVFCASLWHGWYEDVFDFKAEIAKARIKLFFFLTPIALILLGLWVVIRSIPENFKIGVLKKLD